MAFSFTSAPAPAFGAPAPSTPSPVMNVKKLERVDLTKIENLLHLPGPSFAAPNAALRQQLANARLIVFDEKQASLSQQMLEDIFKLADAFAISEEYAIQLYAGNTLEEAKALYVHETTGPLKKLLVAFQSQEFDITNTLMKDHQLIPKMVEYIRNLSTVLESKRNVDFWMQQRERAALVVFFAAYSTQFQVAEVNSILELLQQLKVVNHDPLQQHTPSAFKNNGNRQDFTNRPFTSALLPLEPKDLKTWEKELTDNLHQSGQPQMLRCVAILTMAVAACFTTKHTLMNKETGEEEANPIDANAFEVIFSDETKWRGRKDVWGILCAAFASLQRHQQIPYTKCIQAPVLQKSFSFARFSLIPALQLPHDTDAPVVASEFLLDVLSDITVEYVDMLSASGNYPISRETWEKDQQENLDLRRTLQKQQREFQAWSGTTDDIDSVPSSVDLMNRYDCLDDLVMFCVEVGRLGPAYAMKFWKTESDTDGSLVLKPSRVLLDLERITSRNDSLRAPYLSFIAMLALADYEGFPINGAQAVHKLIMGVEEMDFSTERSSRPTYSTIIEVLRWYIRELEKNYVEGGSKSLSGSSSTSDVGSTRYYYRDSNDTAATSSSLSRTESTSGTKPREIDEENAFILSSYLEIIETIALGSQEARVAILGVELPIQSTSGRDIVGQDSALTILFTLSVSAISPRLRGAVFRAIAALLSIENLSLENVSVTKDYVIKAWDLLDACQIIPIRLLDPYIDQNIVIESGCSFPPSSMAIVSEDSKSSWLPCDKKYSLLFEIEHIEIVLNEYPSSSGFLRLLESLFLSGIYPETNGKKTGRIRLGCTPYIEFVSSYLLPRLGGSFAGMNALPFRVSEERSRVYALCLRTVVAALSRYTVPVLERNLSPAELSAGSKRDYFQTMVEKARESSGTKSVLDTVAVRVSDESATRQADSDFGVSVQNRVEQSTSRTVAPAGGGEPSSSTLEDSGNRLKSPGFTCLVGTLSKNGGSIFVSILKVITEMAWDSCEDCDDVALARALFVSTPPSLQAKKTWEKNSSKVHLEDLIFPLSRLNFSTSSLAGRRWLEEAVKTSLEVLCCAMVRECPFRDAGLAYKTPSRFLPCLEFRGKGATGLSYVDIDLSDLSGLLKNAEARYQVLSSLLKLLIFKSISDEESIAIGSLACSLLFYVDGHRSIDSSLKASLHPAARVMLPYCFSERIEISSEAHSRGHIELLEFILQKLLFDLRFSHFSTSSLAHTLLGLDKNIAPRKDCFSTIMTLLVQSPDSLSLPEKSKVTILLYEIIYRSIQIYCTKTEFSGASLLLSERLRESDFFKQSMYSILEQLTEKRSVSTTFLHCMAWLLKSMSADFVLRSDMSKISTGNNLNPTFMTGPGDIRKLFSLLFTSGTLEIIVDSIPTTNFELDPPKLFPPDSIMKSCKSHATELDESFSQFEWIDTEKLVQLVRPLAAFDVESVETLKAWADSWNSIASIECSSIHASFSLHSLLSCLLSHDVDLSTCSALHTNDVKKLLFRLLNCIERSLIDTTRSNRREIVSSTSNIARSAVTCARYFAVSSVDPIDESICQQIAFLIFRIGEYSKRGDQGFEQNNMIGLLAECLSCLLEKADTQNFEPEPFAVASTVLARVSSIITQPGTEGPYRYIKSARSCLSCVFRSFCDYNSKGDYSYLHGVFTSRDSASDLALLKSMIARLNDLDESIALVLLSIAAGSGGSALLIDSGITNELHRASSKYRELERKEITSRGAESAPLLTPSFVSSYLELMIVLMGGVQEGTASIDLAGKLLNVLECYSSTVERLVRIFPFEGNVLHAFMKCASVCYFVLKSDSLKQSAAGQLNHRLTCEQSMCSFSVSLSECPLPSFLLDDAPAELYEDHDAGGGIFIPAKSREQRKSWWDQLGLKPPVQAKGPWLSNIGEERLTNNVIEFSALSMNLVRSGISVILDRASFNEIDSRSLCRGICQCFSAFKLVGNANSGTLRSDFVQVITDLLLLSVSVVKLTHEKAHYELKVYDEDSQKIARLFSFTLDYTRLDSMGLNSGSVNDENAHAFVKQIATELRGEVKRIPTIH